MLRLWLASQRRSGSSGADETEAKLRELCVAEGWSPEGSDGEEDEEEEMDNSEPQDDSDVVLSDSGRQSVRWRPARPPPTPFPMLLCCFFLGDDLEGYDKMVSGRRKGGRVSQVHKRSCRLVFYFVSVSLSAIFVLLS